MTLGPSGRYISLHRVSLVKLPGTETTQSSRLEILHPSPKALDPEPGSLAKHCESLNQNNHKKQSAAVERTRPINYTDKSEELETSQDGPRHCMLARN